MASAPNENNIEYYDEIAANYDAILDREDSNETIRKRVQEKFTGIVKNGWVLDFGGGTGRDLGWLINNNYQVIFCEPSAGMRNKAIDQHHNKVLTNNVIFLEDAQVDFTHWLPDPPFQIKPDAILSDFAVINCIADIDLLFKTMAHVIKPGGHFIALMLNNSYKKTWRWKVRELIRSLFSRKPVVINVNYNDHKQIVYVYSPKEIKKASAAYFELHSSEGLFEFTLFHFIKR